MIVPDLEHKANNEKYFNSIRYRSHKFKGEKRRAFILQVAEYNIYLAAQCIMSAEKDQELENKLIVDAQTIAQNFSEPENSAKGFLALAEFESLKTIIALFSNIEKPNIIHLQVIAKIFENRLAETFCSFLSIFTETDKTQLIMFAISAYNGELPINNQIKEHLQRFFKYLLDKKLFGLLGIFIEKFNLYGDFSYILGDKTENIIRQISNQKFKGVKLGFKLAEENNLLPIFSAEYFIKKVSDQAGKKPLIFAVSVANKFNSKNQKQLNSVIEKTLESSKKSEGRRLKAVGKDALLKYLSDNVELSNKVSVFFDTYFKSKEKPHQSIEVVTNKKITNKSNSSNSMQDLIECKKLTIDQIFQFYFNDSKRVIFEVILKQILSNFDTNLIELSHKLRIFELQGDVKYLMDYGCYIKPQTFRSERLLFLHKNQISEKKVIDHPNEILKEGDQIIFRIIGINQQNHRLNISCLDSFKVENNTTLTDE